MGWMHHLMDYLNYKQLIINMELLETQTDSELFTEVLSTSNHPFLGKLTDLIETQSKKMSHSTNFVRDYSDADWQEGIHIRNMCDLLFWKGSISPKQIAWMVRYAVKHNIKL